MRGHERTDFGLSLLNAQSEKKVLAMKIFVPEVQCPCEGPNMYLNKALLL